ncbi:MAG: TonB-dependent receptor, partial [Wenzhouxiangellaceae bacterium]
MQNRLQPDRLALVVGLALAALPGIVLAQAPRDVTDDRIVVVGDPLGDRIADEITQPITVLSGEELEKRRHGTLGEMLDGLPGVANSDFGPGVGRPVIRGLQGSRVQVLEDGLRTVDVSGEGADHAIAVDPLRATQIEVYRGPATLLYGSGAAGGVVNTVTRRFDPQISAGPTLSGFGSFGENGNDWQGAANAQIPIGRNFALRGGWSIRRSDDFDIDGFQEIDSDEGRKGRLVNSSVDNDTWNVEGLWSGQRGYLGVGFSRWESDYGIPENFDARPRELGGLSDEFERIVAESDRFDLRAELRDPFPGFIAARIKLAYTEYEQEELEFEFDRTPEGGELDEIEVESVFANDAFETRLEFVHAPVAGLRGVIGVQFNDRDFEAGNPEDEAEIFYVRPSETSTIALFALEELPTEFGKLEFGLRIERERASAGDVFENEIEGVTGIDGNFLPFQARLQSRTFTPISLSAGSIIDISRQHHLRASVTAAERSPSLEQLFAFGRHAAAGTFEIGNPDLAKETYVNFELGIDRHKGPLRYDLGVFYNRVDDFVFLQSVDDGAGSVVFVNDLGNRAGEGETIGCAPGDGGLCRLRNELVFNTQRNAEFYGAELGAVWDAIEGPVPVAWRFSADIVRGELRDGGNLPRITPPRVGVGFDTGWQDFALSIDYQRVFKQTRTAEVEDSTSGFDLLGFDLTWQPAFWSDARFFLRGRNLLNEDGRRHQSFFRDDAP